LADPAPAVAAPGEMFTAAEMAVPCLECGRPGRLWDRHGITSARFTMLHLDQLCVECYRACSKPLRGLNLIEQLDLDDCDGVDSNHTGPIEPAPATASLL
jgi:hypothetical protein